MTVFPFILTVEVIEKAPLKAKPSMRWL